MADKTATERLQPSLLDRLTDDAPEVQKETREARVIDIARLREIIQRDLGWLLNTQNSESWLDAETYPHVAQSVLNYGVREVSGEYATVAEAERIRGAIERSITLFEPRIRDGSTHVTLNPREDRSAAIISFDIKAEMWATPIPLEVYLRTEIDITTGEVNLEKAD
jgi:type VI secretion system protein ImpF